VRLKEIFSCLVRFIDIAYKKGNVVVFVRWLLIYFILSMHNFLDLFAGIMLDFRLHLFCRIWLFRFFKDLNIQAGIDLENIVYYKDETHYFVMTAKKHSLLNRGVLIQVRQCSGLVLLFKLIYCAV